MEVWGVFNIRLALEFEDQVFHLSLNRLENGVLYFHLADVGVQIHRERQRSSVEAVAGGQPEATQALSPGAEEGEEAAQPDAAGARAETPREPVQADLEPAPPEIGQSIMASETAPKRKAKAKAKQRPRR
jgi:hypothetical protein